MERFFQIAAVVLIGVAAYFAYRANWDATFIATVFGAVCFFLSVRFQVKERLKIREAERQRDFEAQDSEEQNLREEDLRNE